MSTTTATPIKAKVKLKGLTKASEPVPNAALIDRIGVLIDNYHENDWALGQCLCAVRKIVEAEGKFGEHLSVKAYLASEHPEFEYDIAQRFMANFDFFAALGLEAEASEIGWSKLAVIRRYKPGDVAYWLERVKVKNLTRRQLEQALGESMSKTVKVGKTIASKPKAATSKTVDDIQTDKLSEALNGNLDTAKTPLHSDWEAVGEHLSLAYKWLQDYTGHLASEKQGDAFKAAGRALDHLQDAIAEFDKAKPEGVL